MELGLSAERWCARVAKRCAIAGAASFIALSGFAAGNVLADPANDAMAKLGELSRQAEQTTESMHSAQLDLSNKLAAQRAAEKKHADDEAAVDAAKSRLATFQAGIDKFAAAMYMGGRTDSMSAILSAASPQHLIDKLTVQRVISAEMRTQMANYRTTREQTALAEQASAKSAADAKTAAEQAAAVRASLQSKQSQLQLQIAIVKSQYLALNPNQRTELAAPGPVPPPAAMAAPAPAPEALPPGGGRTWWSWVWCRARQWSGGNRCPGRVDPGRRALLMGWGCARRVRLLRVGDVGVPAGRHRAAALQPGAGPRRSTSRAVRPATGRRADLLLRRITCRPLHR